MELPQCLEPKREQLSRYFDLLDPTPSQTARLDTLAIYELAKRNGVTNNVVLFGGQAFVTYFPGNRDTVDIDLAVNSGHPKSIFSELGYYNAHTGNNGLHKEGYKRRVGNYEIDLDVFFPGKTKLGGTVIDQKMFEKSMKLNVFDIEVNVCNPVDFVATKLGAGRTKDFLDVFRVVLGKHETIDREYFRERLVVRREELLQVSEHIEDVIVHLDAKKYRQAIEGLLP